MGADWLLPRGSGGVPRNVPASAGLNYVDRDRLTVKSVNFEGHLLGYDVHGRPMNKYSLSIGMLINTFVSFMFHYDAIS